MAWQNYIFHPIIKPEGHCMEKQIHNKLKKDPSRSDDFLSSYSCSKFEKCSFMKNAFKDKSTDFIVKNFIVYYVPKRIMRVITRRATMLAGGRSQGIVQT